MQNYHVKPCSGGARRRKRAVASGVAAAVVALAAGVVGPSALTPAAAQEQTTSLVWSYPQEPPNWNFWQTAATALTAPTFLNVIQPLVEQLGDGSVGPLLAKSWEISPDGLEYTFHLRDAKFHDGSDLDAGDVVYSLEKNKQSPLGPTKGPLSPVTSITAIDDHTVKLVLSRPSQRLLPELGLRSGLIVPKDFFEKHDPNSEMIGTGPYVFGEYIPDVHLTLNRFDDYWGDKPYFEHVTERFIPDETAAINALLTGEIDMIGGILGEGLDRIPAVIKDKRFAMNLTAMQSINFVFLSTHNKALQDDRVRQAIAYAINRDDIIAASESGFAKPICQIVIPPTEPWNNGYCPYPYNPDKARQLLAEAGYKNLTLDFPYLTVAEHPVIKEVLEPELAAVGITLKSRPMDLATWLEQVFANGNYEISNITGLAKAEDYVCGNGRQPLGMKDSQVCDKTFDDLAAKSDSIVDHDEYLKTMAAMVKRFADDAWVIPTFAKAPPTLERADLVGFKGYRYQSEMDLRNLHWAKN